MSDQQAAHLSEAFRLYKANSPFDGQICFTDHLNQSLACGQPLNSLWLSKIQDLDSLIENSPLREVTWVYRATLDAYVSRFINNDELVYPAFMSTSDDEASIQRHFSTHFRNTVGALLKIECPVGTPALNMETDPAFGGHERELLLPRKAVFDVRNVTEISDKQAMAKIMSNFYATSYSSIKVYDLMYKFKSSI